MSDQKTTDTNESATATKEDQATKPASEAATKLPWTTRHRRELTGIAIGMALVAAMGVFMASVESHIDEVMTADNIESAYTDVAFQTVAVNGYRGTEEWRGFYKIGLERYLGQHDFSDLCTPNGFLKDSYVAGALPCIAIGDKRAVKAYDGTISFFKEDTRRRMTHPIDVMRQDVHADDYLDIDAFSTAVRDRATKQVADAEAAAKAAAEEAAKKAKESDERVRAFGEALKSMQPIRIVPPIELVTPSGTATSVVPEDAE
jgi:hypothetical protein